jgi:hypothetical protein
MEIRAVSCIVRSVRSIRLLGDNYRIERTKFSLKLFLTILIGPFGFGLLGFGLGLDIFCFGV